MATVFNTDSLLSMLGWGVALLFFAAFALFVVVSCVRRRRTKKRLNTMKRDLSEVQLVRAEYAKAQQSLVDYEEEKQLLLARLSHGGAECQGTVRRCLREIQMFVALQTANNQALQSALRHKKPVCTNPPALLAEVWVIHGDLYPDRSGENYPDLGKTTRGNNASAKAGISS